MINDLMKSNSLKISQNKKEIVNLQIKELKKSWTTGFSKALE